MNILLNKLDPQPISVLSANQNFTLITIVNRPKLHHKLHICIYANAKVIRKFVVLSWKFLTNFLVNTDVNRF